MSKVGILAYGSLINDPGDELCAATASRIENVVTPFNIEFARSSRSRDGAPTLVPVSEGGAKVKAVILVLKDLVSEVEARDMLWRRETRKVGSGLSYNPPAVPGQNTVLILEKRGFSGLDVVFYTHIAANINTPTQDSLTDLAIRSAQARAGEIGKDGISYLIAAKRYGIVTPLMPGYEKEILRRTQAESLEAALDKICEANREN